MKRLSFIFALTLLFLLAACSDEDSWSAADTCPADGYNVYGMPNRGTFVDERDGQVYKYTTIGDQVWMAQNLNYASEYSMENDSLKDCEECGLWYAIGLSLPDHSFIDTLCPAGWKIPNVEDWEKLISTVGGKANALKVLLSEDWDPSYQGTNECGFNAIQAGSISSRSSLFWKNDAEWATQYVTRPDFIEGVIFCGGYTTPCVSIFEIGWSTYVSIRCIKD